MQSRETSYCPICQTILLRRGTRQRIRYKSEEDKDVLIIRRLYCEKCKSIHHELPDCLVPYKRYSADVIENIVSNQVSQASQAPCPSDTARRIRGWWNAVKVYFLHILQTLVEKFGVSFGTHASGISSTQSEGSTPPALREIVRAAANSNNWIFAHQVCTRSASRPQ